MKILIIFTMLLVQPVEFFCSLFRLLVGKPDHGAGAP
jgi:hypothetical protein